MNDDFLLIERITRKFEAELRSGLRPALAEYLQRIDAPLKQRLAAALIPLEIAHRQTAGEAVTPDEYRKHGPAYAAIAEDVLSRSAAAAGPGDLAETMQQEAKAGLSKFEPEALADQEKLSHNGGLSESASASGSSRGAENAPSRDTRTIGPYKLLQRLGVGGMGEVWVAEQSEPVKRRVALKLIKPGVGSKEILARFEAERQALALMNHPNIARILDAGTTADGQPYFAMELVLGKPLTAWCDENRLSIDDRLRLFADICNGVQHAHQKGIIHRDLKPGNILVTVADGKAVPKVIDFGLAKAMESTQRLTDQSLFTGIGQILGTLKYMSPEQASLDPVDIDTRTDIYALGVILYELLTGSTPLDDSSIKGQAALKILEFIRDKEPVKPSSKLGSSTAEQVSTITGQRKTDSVRLSRVLAGDLDWIVMKALEKDRTRRYESASGFAADVHRYLNNEPVIARPPSLNYRMRKFVRKHRLGVTAASLVTLALVGGILGTTLAMFRAWDAERLASNRLGEANVARVREAEQRTEAERRRIEAERAQALAEAETKAKEQALAEEIRQRQYAEAVTEFLENDFLALTSVEGQSDLFEDESVREMGKDTTLQELLDRAAEKLRQRENLAPEIEARLCSAVGNSYGENGDAEKGIPFLKRALELRREHLGPDHPDTLRSMNNLAGGFDSAGQLDKALPLHEQTVELMKARLGPDHPDTFQSMNNLAASYCDAGQLAKALPLLEATLELRRAKTGPDHPDTLQSMSNLAYGYLAAGQLEKALPLLEQTLEHKKAKLDHDHPETLTSMNNLALGYSASGQLDKALPLFEQALESRKAKFGPDHPTTLTSMNNLAGGYLDAGQLDRALPLFEQTLELMKAKLGPNHPSTLACMNSLAGGYRDAGQLDKALPLYRETLELRKVKLGPDHPDTLTSMNNLAMGYRSAGQPDKALLLFEQTAERQESRLGPDHPHTLITMNNLAMSYHSAGRLNEALPLFARTLELMKAKLGSDHPDTLQTMNNLAVCYESVGRLENALPLLEETLELRKAKLGSDHPDTLTSMNNLAHGYDAAGQPENALPLLEETLELSKTKLGSDHPDTLTSMNNLAAAYWNKGELDKSVALFEQVVLAQEKQLGRGHHDTLTSIANLGVCYKGTGRIEEAIPLLEEAVASSKQFPNLRWVKTPLRDAYLKDKRVKQFAKVADDELNEARSSLPAESVELAAVLVSIGRDYLTLGDHDRALELLEEGFNIRKVVAPDLWNTFNAQALLGGAMLAKARAIGIEGNAGETKKLMADSETLLVQGYEGLKQRESTIPPQAANSIPEALDRLVELYTLLEKPVEAAQYRDLRAAFPPAEPGK